MKGTMKAARMHEVNRPISVDEIPIPEIGPSDVLIRIMAVHINGGDLHLWHGDLPPGKLPMTMLHEPAGVIEEVGSEVEKFKKGDRVAVEARITCMDADCVYCHSDKAPYCPYIGYSGMRSLQYGGRGEKLWMPYSDGAFATFYKIPADHCTLIPDNVSFEIAAKGSASVAYRATVKAEIMPGETVIVNPATGSSGSCAVKTALLFNPGKLIAVGRNERKLDKIKSWAPDVIDTVSSARENVRDRIMEITAGQGADCLIDYSPTGTLNLCEQCLDGLRKCGRGVFIGGNIERLDIRYDIFMRRGITITGSLGYPSQDKAEVLKLISQGKLDFSDMITHRFPITKANEMFETLDKKIGDPMWVLGLPQEE
jgi:threonine dehydrogenase-like Zn-dependent dehydrogenase